MEAAILLGTILSLLPKLLQIADALHTSTHHDPRVNAIHALFLAQQVRAVEWANEMGDVESIAKQLPKHLQEALIVNLKGFEQWNNHSIEKFATYGIYLEERQTEVGNSHTAKTIKLRKIKWAIDGFEKLSEHVNTLKAFNDALWEITRLLQRHHRIVDIDRGHSIAALSVPADPVSIAGSARSETHDRSHDKSLTTGSVSSGTSHGERLKTLYTTCVDALHSASPYLLHHSTQFEEARIQLKLWGLGLFQPPAPLNNIIYERATLQRMIIGTLADIAIILGHILEPIARFEHSLRPVLLRIAAQVGEDDVADEAMDETIITSDVGYWDDFDDELDVSSRCIFQLLALIDCLFDILPTIRMLRHVRFLELEEKAQTSSDSLAIVDNTAPPEDIHEEQISLNELIDFDFKLATAIERSLRAHDTEEKTRIVLKRLKEQVELFEKWRHVMEGQLGDIGQAQHQISGDISENLTSICRGLGSAITGSELSPDMSPSELLERLKNEMMKFRDSKIRVELVDHAVNSFERANRELRVLQEAA